MAKHSKPGTALAAPVEPENPPVGETVRFARVVREPDISNSFLVFRVESIEVGIEDLAALIEAKRVKVTQSNDNDRDCAEGLLPRYANRDELKNPFRGIRTLEML